MRPGVPPVRQITSHLEPTLPDWLQSLRHGEAGQPEESAEPQSRAADEAPEQPGEPEDIHAERSPEEGGSTPATDTDFQEWLASLRQQEEVEAVLPVEEEIPPQEWEGEARPVTSGEGLDWLEEMRAEAGKVEMVDEAQEEEEAAADLPEEVEEEPDWLRRIRSRQQTERLTQGEPAEWLEEHAADEAQAPVEEGFRRLQLASEESFELVGEDQPVGAGAADTIPPFIEGELSMAGEPTDWLAGVALTEKGQAAPTEEAMPEEGSLAQVELPSWLEAMRPLEAPRRGRPQVEAGQVEASGPLSGLRGVLPFEPGLFQTKKPSTPEFNLRVSENQSARAQALEELIKSEGVTQPLPARPIVTSQNLLRIAIFLVLSASIIWSIWRSGSAAPRPEFSPDAFAVGSLINRLSNLAPVLLAVDYEPALSAEMEAASAAVLDHLLLKGASLAIVSTVPTGPTQAERLLSEVVRRGNHSPAVASQHTNLGYIPGGAGGLQAFAQSPRQVTPFNVHGVSAWEGGIMQSIDSLDDFSLVVVITENPQTARAWIEQVKPNMGNTPLIMVVSAQAEPLVRPYYQAYPPQVQGLLTGLQGGVSYERLNARPGPAYRYWDAFSLGLAVSALLIVFGGATNAILAFVPIPKRLRPQGKA